MKPEAITCPRCGAPINVVGGLSIKCEYCGHTIATESLSVYEPSRSIRERIDLLQRRANILTSIYDARGYLTEDEHNELGDMRSISEEMKAIISWIDNEKTRMAFSVDDELAPDGRTIYYVKMTNLSGISFAHLEVEGTLISSRGVIDIVNISSDNWLQGEVKKIAFCSKISEIEVRSLDIEATSIRYTREWKNHRDLYSNTISGKTDMLDYSSTQNTTNVNHRNAKKAVEIADAYLSHRITPDKAMNDLYEIYEKIDINENDGALLQSGIFLLRLSVSDDDSIGIIKYRDQIEKNLSPI